MILRDATIKYSGKDPDLLTKGSGIRVCCSCDNPECKNPIRWLPKQSYRDLCKSCSHIGNIRSDETKLKISKSMKGINVGNKNPMWGKFGKESPNWKGEKVIKFCEICGNKINDRNQKFCSTKCYGKWISENLSGENNPCYGRHPSNKEMESRTGINHWSYGGLMSGKNNPQYGLTGELSPNWKGGFIRDYVLPIRDCNCLNERFKGSEGHHINYDTVIFIPKELHNHLYHNMRTNQGIYEINKLAFQYLIGDI
jgi:hypothetical protein